MTSTEYTILIVDDEEQVRKNIVAYLKLTYTNILEASNGYEAYNIYKKESLDLMITDIQMPKMDGLTLIETIRKENTDLPIVVISAYTDKDKLLRAVKLGLVDYVVKPIARNTLNNLIDKVTHMSKDENTNVKVALGEGFVFDMEHKLLYKNNEIVMLSKQLRVLLMEFIHHKNRVLSSVDIYFYIHDGFDSEYSNGLVRNLVFKLRKILPKDMITNVYGGGYMFKLNEGNE